MKWNGYAFPKKILIVKTSSLGDIIQSFHALDYLQSRFPQAEIDWVVEPSFASIVAAHPLVQHVIAMDLKALKKSWGAWKRFFQAICVFRKKSYDVVFDLQRNCKSGLITALAISPVKVGFGWRTVREWPNILATNLRFDVNINANIRMQYIRLVQNYLNDPETPFVQGVRFKIEESEQQKIQSILASPNNSGRTKIMVCPGSKWINKQVPVETMIEFLIRVRKKTDASFFLMWGDEEENLYCKAVQNRFLDCSIIVDRLPIPTWQNLINEMDLMIAVDSSALHLCGTARTPSFSLFGPTMPEIFKPIGERHFAFRGPCPYGKIFEKACPLLRSCPTGACIRSLLSEEIYRRFIDWWESGFQNEKETH